MSLSSLVLGDYGMDQSNDWPTSRDIGHIKTPRPTKYAPHSYNWKKPSYPKPTYKKTQKPTWQKPTKYSPPKKTNKGWKKNDKPTYTAPQEYDHEPMYESDTYEKESMLS